MRTKLVTALAALLLMSAVPASAQPAPATDGEEKAPIAAAVTGAFSKGVLTIRGTNGDDNSTLEPGCSGGMVTIAGNPISTPCGKVKRVEFYGRGGDDLIDDTADTTMFPNLTSVLKNGGSGDDDLFGTPVRDTLIGGPGYDSLRGSPGNDVFKGSDDALWQAVDGDQTLTDTRLTGLGTDKLSGISYAFLIGGAGANVIDASGFSGYANINGDNGNDTITGGPGGDSLTGGNGSDVINGGRGNDTISPDPSGGTGNDQVNGGPGKDTVSQFTTSPTTASDTQLTGAGTDPLTSIEVLHVEASNQGAAFTYNGGGFSGLANVYSTPLGDSLTAGPGGSYFVPYGGNDTVTGGSGNDVLGLTMTGNMTANNTTISGEGTDGISSIDRINVYGDPAAQAFNVAGFSGNVLISPDLGNDAIIGNGAKTMVAVYTNSDTTVTDGAITSGAQTIGLASIGTVQVGADATNGVTIDGSAFTGKLVAWGGSGKDTLKGGSGKDSLSGGDGNDVLLGGAGADALWSGRGKDSLNGGPGQDRCEYGSSDKAKSCEKRVKVSGEPT